MKFIIYFILLLCIDQVHREEIELAMQLIMESTCLKFLEADATQKEYVEITDEPRGCFSKVGYKKDNVRQMNLQNHAVGQGCFRLGSVMHEIMHILGFYHQHASPNRDEYVKIIAENIRPGAENNFNIQENTDIFAEVGYDYSSVLHFGSKAFSLNEADTIEPLEPAEIGQRENISEKDIEKINILYKCPIKM